MGPPPYRWRTRLSQWRDGAHVSKPAGCSWRAVGAAHIWGSCSCRAAARRADLIGRKRVSTGRTWLLQVCYMRCTRGPPRAGTRAFRFRTALPDRKKAARNPTYAIPGGAAGAHRLDLTGRVLPPVQPWGTRRPPPTPSTRWAGYPPGSRGWPTRAHSAQAWDSLRPAPH